MNLLVLSLLVMQPVLEEPAPMRLVATGVETGVVEWSVDGAVVGRTEDREPLRLWLDAGRHEVRAEAEDHDWMAIARPDPAATGATAVGAWSARTSPAPGPPTAPILHPPAVGAVLAILVVGAVAARRSRPPVGAP